MLHTDNDARTIFRRSFEQRISQSPMEARGIVASKNGEEELLVYIGCQSPHITARNISLSFGIPANRIRVIAKDVGGSFGLKAQPWREEVAALVSAMLLGRPVKWIEDRLEHVTTANLSREQEMTLKVAFDDQGKLLGSQVELAKYPSNRSRITWVSPL